MKKADLRQKYLEKRRALTKAEMNSLSEKIFRNFVEHFNPRKGSKAHVFIPIDRFNEVQTGYFIRYFLENDIRVFLPKMVDGQLIAVEYNRGTEMAVNSWGIAEPVSNEDSGVKDYDFVITPLLYCDANGNRVGFGKGYYDGFFAGINEDCLRIGVSYFEPEEPVDDAIAHDVRLHYLVCPEKILSFRGLL